MIVVVDDDHAYSTELVETLVRGHERDRGRVVGLRGWRVRRDLVWGVVREEYWRYVVRGWELKKGTEWRVGVVTANEVSFAFHPYRVVC